MTDFRLPDFTGLAAPSIRFTRLVTALKAEGKPLAVAWSGGADSTAALLWGVQTFGTHRVIALHFHHGVRGETADRDAEHCRRTSERMGLRFLSGKRTGDFRTDEAALRESRLAFFMSAARAESIAALIQGHHADDVAETLLMRLGRGSGAAGLAAPRPVSALPDGTPVLRPLLLVRKTELIRKLTEADIAWTHDETNDDPAAATRNRVGISVVPAWCAALPGDAVAGAGRTRALLEEDDEALALWAGRAFDEVRLSEDSLDAPKLAALPPAVVRRILRLFLNRHAPGLDLAAAAFDALPESLTTRAAFRISLGRYGFLRNDGIRCVLEPPAAKKLPDALLPVPGAVCFPNGAILSARFEKKRPDDEDGLVIATGPLSCGPCRPGERFDKSSKKIRDVMNDRKIPPERRDRIPVVRDGDTAIWFPGAPPAPPHRSADHEIKPLRLTWTSPGAP